MTVVKWQKFNRVNFKDLVGLIKLFMSHAALHLASGRELPGAIQNGRFYRQRVDYLTFLWGMWQMTSLVLMRKFHWLVKTAFPGEIESATRLGIKFRFGDVGLVKWLHFGPLVSFSTLVMVSYKFRIKSEAQVGIPNVFLNPVNGTETILSVLHS